MREIKALLLVAGLGICPSVVSAHDIPSAELPKYAIEQSQLTLPGSRPFHLKAKVFESTDRDNDSHNAEIEEFWVAADKWRRTVKTANFSEVLIVSGDKTNEKVVGDYYPNWLRTLVNGLFDLGAPLQGVDMSASTDTARGKITPQGNLVSIDAEGPQVCRRFMFLAENPPVTNKIFSTYCFQRGLMQSVGVPGYDVSYSDHKKFGDKQVARKIGEYIESGTELEADIEELTELASPDESLFAVDQANEPLRTVVVKEDVLRGIILSAPQIVWPTLTSGRNPGTLSIYVCLDREGHVRETLGLNSDNPIMTQAARDQLMKWTFKPASSNGARVQVESILTFGYGTKIVPAN
jgi:hypothetical protein